MELSVVLIAKNQAWNTARLIQSVLQEIPPGMAAEIVLVDSASADTTVETASRFPITVIELEESPLLTPSAGRYFGYRHTTGDYILFLDGDMALYPGWLGQGLAVLRTTPEVAAVTGLRIDLPLDAAGPETAEAHTRYQKKVGEVPHPGGAALYRRAVLDSVGPFNPYLYSDEEPELCLRIRHAGYHVLRLDYPIVCHYTAPLESIRSLLERRRRRLWLGSGQTLRRYLGTSLFWPFIRERGFGCVPLLVVMAGPLSAAIGAVTRRRVWFALWAGLVLGMVAADAVRKRSLYRSLYSMVGRLCNADGIARGILLPLREPDTYPVQARIVRRQDAERSEA